MTNVFQVPIVLVKQLAKFVQRAMELQPLTLRPYLDTAEQSGQDFSSKALLLANADAEVPLAETLKRMRDGDVNDPTVLRYAFMLLLVLDGWSRVKVCDQPRCHRIFVDGTNTKSRMRCAIHIRRRPRGSA